MSFAAPSRVRRVLPWLLVMVLGALVVFDEPDADAGIVPPNGIDVVYVTSGVNFPDALGVGPGAAVLNAPVLLVPKDPPIPEPIEAEMTRLDPKRVVIVGGAAAVSEEMEDAIALLLENAAIERIAGPDRYATNAAVSASVFPVESWTTISAGAFTSNQPKLDDVWSGDDKAWNADGGYLNAPIQLPHGAEILAFEVVVTDLDGAGSLTARLVHLQDDTNEYIASVVSGVAESPGQVRLQAPTIDDQYSTVNNELYSYYILVTGATSTNLRIERVHVKYRLGASG